MHADNVISRPAAKKHATTTSDNVELDGSRETDSFLPQQQHHNIPHAPSTDIDPIPMPRELKSFLKTIVKFFCDIGRTLYPYIMNNPPVAFIRGTINYFLSYWLPIYNSLPPETCMHTFTFVVVFVGVLTLFISPAFRSKMSEMRLRPPTMENGIIDEMALSSDRYNIIRNASEPTGSCGESHFRCEFYWTSGTDDAQDTQTTYYCTAYVCQGMTVRVNVLPQSCSGNNKVGVGAILKDIYGKPVYDCADSGCGECSSITYTNLEAGPIYFLQGCNEEESCYGQIAVSLSWDATSNSEITVYQEPQSRSPWSRFRGGPYNHGVADAIGPGSVALKVKNKQMVPNLKWEMSIDGGSRSSPAIGTAGVVYIGADNKHIYALKADEDVDSGKKKEKDKKGDAGPGSGMVVWKYTTGGKVAGSPILSPDESMLLVGSEDGFLYAIAAQTGALQWKYQTDGEISAAPALLLSPRDAEEYPVINQVLVGSHDGYMHAVTQTGAMKWKFSTEVDSKPPVPEKGRDKEKEAPPAPIVPAEKAPVVSSAVMSPDGTTVYFGCDNAYVFAVNVAGTTAGSARWRFMTGGPVVSSPTISSDGQTVFVGSNDMHIYALSNKGIMKWRYYAGGSIRSSPALSNGVLYFTTTSKNGETKLEKKEIAAERKNRHHHDRDRGRSRSLASATARSNDPDNDSDSDSSGDTSSETTTVKPTATKASKSSGSSSSSGSESSKSASAAKVTSLTVSSGTVTSPGSSSSSGTSTSATSSSSSSASTSTTATSSITSGAVTSSTGGSSTTSMPPGTNAPVAAPITPRPTYKPSGKPTMKPTAPTPAPSDSPTVTPTSAPTEKRTEREDPDDFGHLFAVTVNGEMVWRYPLSKGSLSSPLIDAEGAVYTGAEDGYVYAMSGTGALIWKYAPPGIGNGGTLPASPAMDSDGNLYMVAYSASKGSGKLYSIGVKEQESESTSSGSKESSTGIVVLGDRDGESDRFTDTTALLWTCSVDSTNEDRDDIATTDEICLSAEEESQGVAMEPDSDASTATDIQVETLSASIPAGVRARDRARRIRRRLRAGGKDAQSESYRNMGRIMNSNSNSNGNRDSGYSDHEDGIEDEWEGHTRELRSKKKHEDDDDDGGKKNKKIKTKVAQAKKASAAAAKPPSHTCIPGLSMYVGRGVDITHYKHDPDFIRGRVFEFRDLRRIFSFHGVDHLAPPKEELEITTFEQTVEAEPILSGLYTGLKSYTEKLSQTINATEMLQNYPVERIPATTLTSLMVNGTGFYTSPSDYGSKSAPPVAVAISNNAARGKASLVNVATFTHAKYSLVTPTEPGSQLCGKSFADDIDNLPGAYDENAYRSLIRRYGTHVVTSVTIGGSITSVTPYDACSLTGSDYKSTAEAANGYKDEVGEFVTYRKYSSMLFLGQNVSRIGMNICGGKAATFTSPDSRSPFSMWSQTTVKDKTRPCAVYMDVVPIYATVNPNNPIHRHLAAAVFEHIYSVRHETTLDDIEVPSACSVQEEYTSGGKSSSSKGDKSGKSKSKSKRNRHRHMR